MDKKASKNTDNHSIASNRIKENKRKPTLNKEILEEGIPPLSNNIPSLESSSSKSNDIKEHIRDIAELSPSELNKKYKLTYNSWRNMKQRKKDGAIIDEEFEDFASFLRHVGPRPPGNYTLDRVDNNNRMYGPGLCRWSDKRDQANNRSSTIFLTSESGECHPLTEWAKRLGERPDTLRKRKQNGWTDEEIIRGKRLVNHRTRSNKHSLPCPWWGSDENKLKLESGYQRLKCELESSSKKNKRKIKYENRHTYALRYIRGSLPQIEIRLCDLSGEIVPEAIQKRIDLLNMRRDKLLKQRYKLILELYGGDSRTIKQKAIDYLKEQDPNFKH